jgi:hypothetical protein
MFGQMFAELLVRDEGGLIIFVSSDSFMQQRKRQPDRCFILSITLVHGIPPCDRSTPDAAGGRPPRMSIVITWGVTRLAGPLVSIHDHISAGFDPAPAMQDR